MGSVGLSVDATDDIGVDRVEFAIAGTTVGIDSDGSDGWSLIWDSTAVAEGPVALQATAFDLNAYLGSEGVDISQLTIGEEVSWKVTTTEVFTLVGSPRFRGIATEIYFRYRNAMSILDSMRQMIVQVE